MKTKTRILGVIFLSTLALTINAQDNWNWGDQVDLAKEKNVIYTDAYKAKNFDGAKDALDWLLENTPDLNPSIYINGIKVYEGLAKKETDPAVKEALINRGLELHDKRIQYFGKEGDVTVRQAYFAYAFYNTTKEK